MKKTTTLFIFLSACGLAMGQCTVAIPANAVSVTTLQSTTPGDGQFLWVCAGGLAPVAGNGNTVAVELSGMASLLGNNNTLYIRVGTYVSGSNNTVYTTEPGNVVDLGTNTQIITCSAITFNYTSAPSTGCLNVGISELSSPVRFEVFPNPVGSKMTLTMEGARMERVRLFDVRGGAMLDRTTGSFENMDVADLPAGLYMLVADTDHGRMMRKVVKQ